MKKPDAPCYRCEYRKPGCHSICDAYKNYRAAIDRKQSEYREKQAAEHLYCTAVMKKHR